MVNKNILEAVIPQFFPAQWLVDTPEMVSTDFPSCIRIGYVQREEGGYSYLMRSDLDNTDISLDTLHQSALQNLRKLPCLGLKIGKTPGGSEAFLTGIEDNFQAARILLPSVQNAIAQKLGDKYFLAIPCRDWFVCWSLKQSTKRQEHNKATARTEFIEDDYNLTPDILLRSDSGFSVHMVQKVDV